MFQLLISALAEEPGWRGFALPHLQEAYGVLKGTLILGVCWGCCHFPLFLIPGYGRAETCFLGVSIPFAEFPVSVLAATIIIAWVFNHTRGSLLIAMVIHASNDGFPLPSLFPHLNISDQKHMAMMVSFSVLALIILAASWGKLGYQSSYASQSEKGDREDHNSRSMRRRGSCLDIQKLIIYRMLRLPVHTQDRL